MPIARLPPWMQDVVAPAVRHETVRFWWHRFGPVFVAEIRKMRLARLPVVRNGGST
ncbi:MAG: hypothetical protein HQ481_18010 [Alphaproteobacteria bacterium]|nr:hypothetical protein [Alphaproteobacteria bacterium]